MAKRKLKLPRSPEKPKKPIVELFASEEDIDKASRIAKNVLGDEVEVNYTDMPKNIGVKGDTGVRAYTPVISVDSRDELRRLVSDPKLFELVGDTGSQICNEGPASKVLLDLTPEAGPFKVESEIES